MITEQARVQLKTAYGVFHLSAFSNNVNDLMPHLVISSKDYQSLQLPPPYLKTKKEFFGHLLNSI